MPFGADAMKGMTNRGAYVRNTDSFIIIQIKTLRLRLEIYELSISIN